jgi:hypothetical protein
MQLPKVSFNRRLAQWRVQWLIEHSASQQLLWCIDSFVLRNPLLRQASAVVLHCNTNRPSTDLLEIDKIDEL